MRLLQRGARARLSAAERQDAYADRLDQVLPSQAPVRAPGEPPRVVLVSAQQGAGKTTIQAFVHTALGADRVASYDVDDDAEVHPRFEAIMRAYGRGGHHRAHNALPAGLSLKTVDHLRAGLTKYDVIASPVLDSRTAAEPWVDGFREHGYRVSVVLVATNEANSLLSIADRYQGGRDATGAGRWVEADVHDETYSAVPGTAHQLEAEGLVDDIYVVDRDGHVLYENHRDVGGTMERPLGAREAINAERNRPPTPAEHEHFTRTHDALVNRRDPSLPPLEPAVREMAMEAARREQARGEPRPVQHLSGRPGPRIDQRLAGQPAGARAGGGQAGAGHPAAGQPAPGQPAGGPPPGGLDPALLAAQQVAGDGVGRLSSVARGGGMGAGAAGRPDSGPGRGGDGLGPADNRPRRGSPDALRRGSQGSPRRDGGRPGP